MKNKKGFTLIELLAVIVILAIIALIAVPIILNMINSARKSAAKSSALGYIDSIEYYAGFNQISNDTGITGYDTALPEMTEGKVTCTKTSSGWNSECSAFFTAVDKKAKGKKPDAATIILSSTGKVQANSKMTFNGYEVTYDGKDALIGNESSSESESSTPSVPEPVAFSTDSWETIAANTTSDKYHVGDEKEVEIDINGDGTAEKYHLRIANTSTPSECSSDDFSQSACGLVLEFVEHLDITSGSNYENGYMNPTITNEGGWPASKMYSYLNTTVYNKFSTDLQNVIKTTKVITSHGNKSGETNFESQDKIYLLSAKEVGIDGYDTAKNNTRTLDYYEGKDDSYRVKYQYNTDYSNDWWLRTADSRTNWGFYVVARVDGHGNPGYSPSSYRGVSPAFRIGN